MGAANMKGHGVAVSDFERTFGAGADAVAIVEGYGRSEARNVLSPHWWRTKPPTDFTALEIGLFNALLDMLKERCDWAGGRSLHGEILEYEKVLEAAVRELPTTEEDAARHMTDEEAARGHAWRIANCVRRSLAMEPLEAPEPPGEPDGDWEFLVP